MSLPVLKPPWSERGKDLAVSPTIIPRHGSCSEKHSHSRSARPLRRAEAATTSFRLVVGYVIPSIRPRA